MNLSIISPRANSGLVWESWIPPMKESLISRVLSLKPPVKHCKTLQTVPCFFVGICEFTGGYPNRSNEVPAQLPLPKFRWPFRQIQAFLLAALKNNVNLRALHDAARIFFSIPVGIGRVLVS